jgi:hypothetical protein
LINPCMLPKPQLISWDSPFPLCHTTVALHAIWIDSFAFHNMQYCFENKKEWFRE